MRKLRNSLPIRVGAWLLFLVMVSGAAFFGLQCVRGIPVSYTHLTLPTIA